MKSLVCKFGGLTILVEEQCIEETMKEAELAGEQFEVMGEFIPKGSQRLIGKKDVNGVDIMEADMIVYNGMNFSIIAYGEYPVTDGVIMGYFVPDGAEVLRKNKEKKKS